jgi:hypothetical protein
MGIYLDVLEGRPLTTQRVFARALRLPALLVQYIVTATAIALALGLTDRLLSSTSSTGSEHIATCAARGDWTRFLLGFAFGTLRGSAPWIVGPVALGLAFFSGFVFCLLQLAHDPKSTAISSLQRCSSLIAGHRLRVVGISLVTGASTIAIYYTKSYWLGVVITPFPLLVHCTLFLTLKNRRSSTG